MRTRLDPRAEGGVAALEFVLVMFLILGLVALTAPLAFVIQERVRLERVAGHAARFATAAPDRPRFGAASRRPSPEEVAQEAVRAYVEIGGGSLSPSAVSVSSDPRTTRPGDQIEVAIIQTVGLGAFGSVLASIDITATDLVMNVTAQARQE